MPKQSDEAIKFLTEELKATRLDPRTDAADVIEQYKSVPTVGVQLLDYVSTNKKKGNFATYWSRLRKEYLNQFENLNPAREGTGPAPAKYPEQTERYEGDKKGTSEKDEEKPKARPTPLLFDRKY